MRTPRDANGVTTLLGVSDADGITPMSVIADPTTHAIEAIDGTTSPDLDGEEAKRDENQVTSIMAVSSVDGVTPVTLYLDSLTGKLLIDSN